MSTIDRYDTPPDPEKRLEERLREIERQLGEMQRARPMMATLMKGGSFELDDEAGGPMLRFGQFGEDGDGNPRYGVVFYGANGENVFDLLDTDRGITFPHDSQQWIAPTPQSISSTSFVSVAEKLCILPIADALQAEAVVICPVGSTAEVRINASNYGLTTNTVIVPSGAQRLVVFEWQHPFSVGWGDSAHPQNSPFLHWEVRLASGAGPVTAYPPRHLTWRNKRFLPLSSTAGGGRFG